MRLAKDLKSPKCKDVQSVERLSSEYRIAKKLTSLGCVILFRSKYSVPHDIDETKPHLASSPPSAKSGTLEHLRLVELANLLGVNLFPEFERI